MPQWSAAFPSLSSNTRTLIFGVTLGVSLAKFLTWLLEVRRNRRHPLSEKRISPANATTTLDGLALQTKPSHMLGPGSRASVDSHSRHANHHHHSRTLPIHSKGDEPMSSNAHPATSAGFSRGLSNAPPSQSYIPSQPVPEEAGRGEIARLGVFAIHQVIVHLQDALANLERVNNKSAEDQENGSVAASHEAMAESDSVLAELRSLLEQAVLVHERCKQELTTVVTEYHPSQSDFDSGGESDEVESFVSAVEYIDLSDLQVQLMVCSPEDHLYKAALLELDHGNITYREVRTSLTGCSSDTEYLAKLHCIRLAFDHMFQVEEKRDYMIQIGSRTVCLVLESMRYNTTEFKEAYRQLCEYVAQPDNRPEVFDALESRGVAVVNVYDVVFDYLLLDGLEHLRDPPSSLMTVIQNRWLTDSFKKTALDSVVWTLLLAKKKMVKNPLGFTNHLYALVATIGPAFCWGFLGSDPQANAVCNTLRESIMEFVTMMFSQQTRFTCVEELSDDIVSLSKKCIEGKLMQYLHNSMTASV